MSLTVDKSGDRVRRMFAQIAPRYDLLNHVLSLNIDRWWRARTVKALLLPGTEPVLDACTGTGDLALAIARRLGNRAPVVGTDFCSEMLELARRKQERLGLPSTQVKFIEADTQSLPVADGSCQAVTVAFGLRNVADTDAGLRELARVCKPGGQVAVLEFSKPTALGLRHLYDFYFRRVLPRVGQLVAKNDQSAYRYLPDSVQSFPCGQALIERMEAAGLQRVRMLPMTYGIATLYLGEK
jgi:demethylmenaquinone methyltransferase/2-methoxy-6-polyprenyl-1,4-benzoquinol methylase